MIDRVGLFGELSELAIEIDRVVGQLIRVVGACGVSLAEGEDWYDLLSCKLLPQVGDRAYLIISVMGGTNTGKSVIFNHLVGNYCSGVDHRASGTKHPVCVVSGSIPNSLDILRRNFCHFNLVEWSRSEQPLESCREHQLFWKVDNRLEERLLIFDTPDIDSDNELNWVRARGVRNAADVIIAVLTSQKYNDAAVRRFFREAAEAAKPVIVIFNMVDIERDVEHITIWLKQFCDETGCVPIAVLAAPFDGGKAAELRLPFYQLPQDGKGTEEINDTKSTLNLNKQSQQHETFVQEQLPQSVLAMVDLRRIFTELHFDRIKSQTLIGAIRVIIDESNGLPSFLRRVEVASNQFGAALAAIEGIDDKLEMELPAMPISVLAGGMWAWWNEAKRAVWLRRINDVYRVLGGKLVYPFSKLWGVIVQKLFSRVGNTGYGQDNLLRYLRESEEGVVVGFIETIFGYIERLAETDNLVLRREMLSLVSGGRRVEILARAKVVLSELDPVEVNFDNALRQNLTTWAAKNLVWVGLIKLLDLVVTLVRPVFTVLFIVGGLIIGSKITGQWFGVVLAAGVLVICGEAVVYSVSEAIKLSLAKLFKHIQDDFISARSKKFHATFLSEFWHDVVNRLKSGSAIAKSKEFQDCQTCLKKASKKI
ncbi:MAG: GTPase domain-containing protein [Planctomycetaceae bacterium]|nr:GTPase domain-containing protein [Planctomycetaceae bacterium]